MVFFVRFRVAGIVAVRRDRPVPLPSGFNSMNRTRFCGRWRPTVRCSATQCFSRVLPCRLGQPMLHDQLPRRNQHQQFALPLFWRVTPQLSISAKTIDLRLRLSAPVAQRPGCRTTGSSRVFAIFSPDGTVPTKEHEDGLRCCARCCLSVAHWSLLFGPS